MNSEWPRGERAAEKWNPRGDKKKNLRNKMEKKQNYMRNFKMAGERPSGVPLPT